jgi:prolipoprotein diacylglyceryltransferase
MEFRLLAAALFACAVVWAALSFTHGGDRAAFRRRVDLALGAIVIGLVTGRVAAMVLAGSNPLTRPGDLLIVRGGVDTAFAAVSAVLGAAVIAKRRTIAELAALAPAALAGLAGWHTGCIVRDACLGTPSGLPWAWTEPGGTVTRHPVELYAAAALAAAAVIVAFVGRRGVRPTTTAGLAVTLAAVARLATEPMRHTIGGSRASFYLVASLVGLAVVLLDRRAGSRPGARPSPPSVHS